MIRQKIPNNKQMINNGKDVYSCHPYNMIQRNKILIPRWQKPKQTLYSQYKQQKINALGIDYQSINNYRFGQSYQGSIFHKNIIQPNRYYSRREQNHGIKHGFTSNYHTINITDNNLINYGDFSSRKKKSSQNVAFSKLPDNSTPFFDKKSHNKQIINKQKRSGRSAREVGTIKSSSLKRRAQVQGNTFDRVVQFIKQNNNIRQQLYLEQPRILSAHQRQRQPSYKGQLFFDYNRKYNKYFNNQKSQQLLNATLYPKYNNYLSNQMLATSQLLNKSKQNSYQNSYQNRDRKIFRQLQKNYRQPLKLQSHRQDNDYGELKPSIYRYNEKQQIKYYQPVNIVQRNKDKYQREQLNSRDELQLQNKLYQKNNYNKLSKVTPIKINNKQNQEQLISSRRQQLIQRSKILRQKYNELSGQKNMIDIKSGKESVTQFSDESNQKRLNRLKNSKDRGYNSPYQNNIKSNKNLRLKYGTLLQNKSKQHHNNKIKFTSKSVDLTVKQLQNNKQGILKQLKLTTNQFQQKDIIDDPVNRIKSINNKINTKINSIISYGK